MSVQAARKSLDFFYDVISPYSWISYEVLCRYQHRWKLDINLKPVFLGGLLAETDNHGPAEHPIKAAYVFKDIQRLQQYYQMPLKVPADYKLTLLQKGTLKAQRLLTAVTLKKPEYTKSLSESLWMRIWSKDEDIKEPSSLIEACKAAGITETDAASLVDQVKDIQIKAALRDATQEAVDRGLFGLPAVIVTDLKGKEQMVFGSDRMHILAMIIGEKYEGPLDDSAKM